MTNSYLEESSKLYKFYKYLLPNNWEVIAGKTNIDNDFLSIKLADTNDLWFHVRGMPGSHVILKSKKGEIASKEIISMVASIAAYHSKARNGGVVSVSFTFAKFVSKPKGAKPGSVVIKKEKTIKVRPKLPET